MENPAIEVEFEKHEAWRTKTQLRATPTVLVNGYQLPESYKVGNRRLTVFYRYGIIISPIFKLL